MPQYMSGFTFCLMQLELSYSGDTESGFEYNTVIHLLSTHGNLKLQMIWHKNILSYKNLENLKL